MGKINNSFLRKSELHDPTERITPWVDGTVISRGMKPENKLGKADKHQQYEVILATFLQQNIGRQNRENCLHRKSFAGKTREVLRASWHCFQGQRRGGFDVCGNKKGQLREELTILDEKRKTNFAPLLFAS